MLCGFIQLPLMPHTDSTDCFRITNSSYEYVKWLNRENEVQIQREGAREMKTCIGLKLYFRAFFFSKCCTPVKFLGGSFWILISWCCHCAAFANCSWGFFFMDCVWHKRFISQRREMERRDEILRVFNSFFLWWQIVAISIRWQIKGLFSPATALLL